MDHSGNGYCGSSGTRRRTLFSSIGRPRLPCSSSPGAPGSPAIRRRQIAPLILDGCEKRREAKGAIRRIVEITAAWSSFHFADNEYAARATVQKARELLNIIETMEAREARAREIARQEELALMETGRADLLKRESKLLLMMLDDLGRSDDSQRRGYLLQDLLNRLFLIHQIPAVQSFTRNERAEQIDGAFRLEGWHYIVEC